VVRQLTRKNKRIRYEGNEEYNRVWRTTSCAATATSLSCSRPTCAIGRPKATSLGFILDVVDQLDLEPFLRGYWADGHGHPAYDPRLLGVLYG
jgi:hypothetical protein